MAGLAEDGERVRSIGVSTIDSQRPRRDLYQ